MHRLPTRLALVTSLSTVLLCTGCAQPGGSSTAAVPAAGSAQTNPTAMTSTDGQAGPSSAAAIAETSTRLAVRVIAKGGKFLGDDVGGARVTVRDLATGALLASGIVSGGSGDTGGIMTTPRSRATPIPVSGASSFDVTLAISEPTRVEITAEGPGGGLQSTARVSGTYWLLPGHDMTDGDGVLLELPGLLVQVMEPATHSALGTLPQTVPLVANVTMMCGCPIATAGPWPASEFDVTATIRRAGEVVVTVPLSFTDTTSRFAGEWTATEPGFYVADVTATQHGTTNTGAGRVTFFATMP